MPIMLGKKSRIHKVENYEAKGARMAYVLNAPIVKEKKYNYHSL